MSQYPWQKSVLPSGVVSTRQRELQGSGSMAGVPNLAANSEIDPENGVLEIYTDGSHLPSGGYGGAGVAYQLGGEWHTLAKSLLLPSDDQVIGAYGICVDRHDAEMLAIKEALLEIDWLARKGAKIDHAVILTDSQTCITRLTVGGASRLLILTTREADECWTLVANRGITVEMVKVEGHARPPIPGNEKADKLAGFGARLARQGFESRGKLVRDPSTAEMENVGEMLSGTKRKAEGTKSAAWNEERTGRKKQQKRERDEEKREEALTQRERIDRMLSG
ncbi:unnamed protein product [Zymoseptoria tritici ST99CH_3D7]|uniref:RNase H type-1 domain-containing protein n=1 Tax=Zymoseptoria tritici (strain ST99CH_3D7) TaxID=1276538 RepID=A0A1X7S9K0_ZYMT9|nr:unnamed protein product [Zymoseptoria tritici ST99CH_3D7]